MKFMLTHSLDGMHPATSLEFPVEIPVGRSVRIKFRTDELTVQGEIRSRLLCDTSSERNPPPNVVEALHALRERRLLLDDPPQVELPYGSDVDEDGRIATKVVPPLRIMPRRYREFQKALHDHLGGTARRFIRTLRWRQAAAGGHQALGHVSFQWSEDGEEWTRLPHEMGGYASIAKPLDVSREALDEGAVLFPHAAEPIAHELIREAKSVSSGAPRSGLLIGYTALETGVKQCIASVAPSAGLLLEKMPSPPLLSLLNEILPRIFEREGRVVRYLPLRPEETEYLQKWVSQRNQITHGTKHGVDGGKLKDFLTFATDLLYVLDFNLGHQWALEQLSSRQSMRIVPPDVVPVIANEMRRPVDATR
jgi:hypothetical protein